MTTDLRFAFRQLRKHPGFAAAAVLALALGIGANTALFSLLHGLVLRPLPFPDQDRLLFIGEWSEQVPQMSVSYPNFEDWRVRQRAFSHLGAFRQQTFNLHGAGEAERLAGTMASHDLFAALGVPALHGRLFTPADDRPGADRTALISEAFWQRRFGGRPEALGAPLRLNGESYTVVGILPAAFGFPAATIDVWVPLGLFADQYRQRGNHPGLYCIGRLKPGVAYEAGVADIKAVAERLAVEYPDTNARQSAAVERLTDRVFGRVRPALLVLLGAAGFVLLIACANVANLQLARAQARAREFAVRAALGAGRARLVRQLLVESLLLGALGCAAGLVVGVWGLDALRALLPASTPRLAEVSLDGTVLAFAVVVSLVTSVLFGLVPALHATRLDLRDALAQGARGSTASGQSWRTALVVGEFALTAVLLVGAGLMLRTLANLHATDPGFSTDRILTAGWALPGSDYADPARRAPVIARAVERLAAVPGVAAAAFVNPLPLGGGGRQNVYYLEGTPLPEPGRQPSTEVFQVSDNLFSTLRIPLLAGRTFEPRDTASSPRVAVVDAAFVAKNFPPGTDPLGKRFAYGSRPPAQDSDWYTIVGVVAPLLNYGPASTQRTREQTYVSATQSVPSVLSFVFRTEPSVGHPAALAPSLRAALREAAPDLPLFGLQTMDELFAAGVSNQRLGVFLLGTFAVLALVLAALGLYGVLAFQVGRRTREIGVRLALGATPAAVVALILRHGLKLAALGLALGLLAAAGLSRLLEALLYRVSALDPWNFLAVAVLLAALGTLASWLPARRATGIDPMVALRAD